MIVRIVGHGNSNKPDLRTDSPLLVKGLLTMYVIYEPSATQSRAKNVANDAATFDVAIFFKSAISWHKMTR